MHNGLRNDLPWVHFAFRLLDDTRRQQRGLRGRETVCVTTEWICVMCQLFVRAAATWSRCIPTNFCSSTTRESTSWTRCLIFLVSPYTSHLHYHVTVVDRPTSIQWPDHARVTHKRRQADHSLPIFINVAYYWPPAKRRGIYFSRVCVSVSLSVCLSVGLYVCIYVFCLSDDNFRKFSRRKFIFAHPGIRVKFVYERHRINLKVTGSKNVGNACSCIDQLPSSIFIGTRQVAPRTSPRGWPWPRLRLEGNRFFVVSKIAFQIVSVERKPRKRERDTQRRFFDPPLSPPLQVCTAVFT